MAAVPLKPAYGPTSAQLLSPSWRRAPFVVRLLAIAAGCGLVLLIGAAVLALLPARISHAGPVPFHFSYKGLYRVAPEPGGYAKVSRRRGGVLEDSFAVGPLQLPPYQGSLSGDLPLYASTYIAALSKRDPGFELRGEGKTRVNTVPGYNVFYTALLEGRRMWRRDVLLLPEQTGVRRGVVIMMVTSPTANREVKSVLEIATAGVLQRALHTFTFG
jgi:hypothetical protein